MVQALKNISSEPTLCEPNKTGLGAGSSSYVAGCDLCGAEEAVGFSGRKEHMTLASSTDPVSET